jgi:predicted DNA-binding transcriptional regulator YafY
MRGDQLARQWRVIRAIEASPNGLTVAEIAQREETGIHTIYRDLEALQEAGFSLYTEKVERGTRLTFNETFRFKFHPSFSLTELRSFVFTAFPTEGLKGIPSYNSLDSMRRLRK